MHIQNDVNNLAVLFYDSKNSDTDKELKKIYHSIYQQGDFIKNYTHIIDSVLFDWSHQSCGIQIADYCAGVFNGFLKSHDESIELFVNRIWDKIRNQDGDCFGYGIREVPRNRENRNFLKNEVAAILDSF